MRGREPIGYRAAERAKLFVSLDLAVFIALIVIFIADFIHDYSDDPQRFAVRLVAYQLIALLASFIAIILITLRSNTWETKDRVLVLYNWADLSGEHQVVGLRIQTDPRGKTYLEAVLAMGEVVRLAKGDTTRMKQLRTDLAGVLGVTR